MTVAMRVTMDEDDGATLAVKARALGMSPDKLLLHLVRSFNSTGVLPPIEGPVDAEWEPFATEQEVDDFLATSTAGVIADAG